jgi:hypothetical protein
MYGDLVMCIGHVGLELFSSTAGFPTIQGLPGDRRDRASARKFPQNYPWGVVNSARKKKIQEKKPPFYSHPIANIAPICLQIPSNVKVTLGKSFLLL